MMIYHPIIFGCKKISSSVDMVETVTLYNISPNFDLDLDDSKPIFLHDNLAHDDASPYQVWLQNVQQLRRYRPDEHSLEYWVFPMTAIRSFHKTTQLMMTCFQTKLICKRISRPGDILESHNLILWSFTATVSLKTANQSFWKTIWLMMMLHCTKLGSKSFSGSEEIILTNIYRHFWNFAMTLTCNPIAP